MFKKFNRKAVTSVLSTAVLFCFTGSALADSFDTQIAALRAQAATQQQQADTFSAQVNDYQSKVAQLQAQISSLQAQINLNQAEYNQVTQNINDNEAKLEAQKTVLSANIKSMYLDSTITPLEMLASSQNFSDFLDQQEYQDKIKTKIQDAMSAIQTLQDQLKKQQSQVAGLLVSQHTQQDQLAAAQNQVNSLLATAQQSAAAANQQVQASNAQANSLRAQQAAILAAASHSYSGTLPGSSGGSGGACDVGHGNGGYPMSWCNAPQDSITTPWGYSRECVSWAGWRRQQLGRPVYAWGNANQWASGAEASGFTVNSTPEVGAVAQTSAGAFGHVAVVEAVPGNGTVIVSQMNYDDAGHYDEAVYSASYFVYIH